jgi:ferritin-like metal-binding protein YciE
MATSTKTQTETAEEKSNGTLKNQKNLRDLLETGLKDIYSAEKQLVMALPEIAQAADSEELQDAVEDHLEQTKRHVERLDKIFDRLRISKTPEKKCEAMAGLLEEGKKILTEFERGPVRDSALIIGSQKIEHYEIAAYGSLCELADVLGEEKVHDILGRTLDEEEETDKILSEIAQQVNDEAHELSEEWS